MGVTEVLDAGGLIQSFELRFYCHLRFLKGLELLRGAVRYDTRPRGDLCSSRLVAGGQVGLSNGTRPRDEGRDLQCISVSETEF